MEEEIKGYVLQEEVSRTNIRKLAIYSSEDRLALCLVLAAEMGENRLREMLTLLDEISKGIDLRSGRLSIVGDSGDSFSQETYGFSENGEDEERFSWIFVTQDGYLGGTFERKKRNLEFTASIPIPLSFSKGKS
jgi:hypothetical protein